MFNAFDAAEDALYELNARHDYMQEAFGSFCQTHKIHYGADCPACEEASQNAQDELSMIELLSDAPGRAVVSTDVRRYAMKLLMDKGFRVKCVGTTLVWDTKRTTSSDVCEHGYAQGCRGCEAR